MIHHTLLATGFAPVTGGAIHYRYYEPHDAQASRRVPLLFVHGGPGASHAMIYDALSVLADDQPVLFYDQLGSYYSPAKLTPDLMTIDRFASEIPALLDCLSIRRALVVGHSWGGAVAAQAALHHAGRFAGLVLSSPLLSSARWVADCQTLLAAMPDEDRATITACEAAGDTDCEAYRAAEARFYDRHLMRTNPAPALWSKHRGRLNFDLYQTMWGPSEFSCTGLLRDLDLFPSLGQLTMPTLLTCGAQDTARPATMHAAAALIPHARVQVFEDCGHMPYIDQPDAYIAVLREQAALCNDSAV